MRRGSRKKEKSNGDARWRRERERERERRTKKEGRYGLKLWCNQLVCRRVDANIRTGHGQGERKRREKAHDCTDFLLQSTVQLIWGNDVHNNITRMYDQFYFSFFLSFPPVYSWWRTELHGLHQSRPLAHRLHCPVHVFLLQRWLLEGGSLTDKCNSIKRETSKEKSRETRETRKLCSNKSTSNSRASNSKSSI